MTEQPFQLTDFCQKKHYQSRSVAKQAAKLRRKQQRVPITIYFCEKCNAWHLTSIDTETSRMIDRKRKGQE